MPSKRGRDKTQNRNAECGTGMRNGMRNRNAEPEYGIRNAEPELGIKRGIGIKRVIIIINNTNNLYSITPILVHRIYNT